MTDTETATRVIDAIVKAYKHIKRASTTFESDEAAMHIIKDISTHKMIAGMDKDKIISPRLTPEDIMNEFHGLTA